MAFNSFPYLIFLLIALFFYYSSRKLLQQQWILIISSLVFISWFNLTSAVAILALTLCNYYNLRALQRAAETKKQHYYYAGIILNASILLAYKILQDIFSHQLLFTAGFNNSKWILLGIGFYTLQLIGYYIEVFKNRKQFNFTLTEFAIGVIFFAKVPSGPILQLRESALTENERKTFSEENFAAGIQRLLLGIFKKVALADRLAQYVNGLFDSHGYLTGFHIYIAPILFTIQLYFDFSGYIDMAVGTARLFGIRLPENFAIPLRATSIAEFWRRWHITLVNWLKQYIFFPVSYRYRKFKIRGVVIAVVVTFLVSAAWHGLAITFFIWAACHFIYLAVEANVKLPYRKSPVVHILRIFWVWNLVAFSHLFFRAHSLTDLHLMLNAIRELPFWIPEGSNFKTWLINGGRDIEYENNYRFAIALSLAYLAFEKWFNRKANSNKYSVGYVALLLVLIVALGIFNVGARFIYFQF